MTSGRLTIKLKNSFLVVRNIRIKAVLETVLSHFICYVNYLVLSDPSRLGVCFADAGSLLYMYVGLRSDLYV